MEPRLATKARDPRRKAFTAQLVEALRAAEEAAQRAKTPVELARQAYDALQFDFPLVAAEELRALTDAYTTGPGFPPTPKLLEVVREGALAPASSQGAAAAAAPPASPPYSSSSSSAAAGAGAQQPGQQAEGGAGASGSGSGGSPAPGSATEPLLPHYQQLYAAMVVRLVEAALAPTGHGSSSSSRGSSSSSSGAGGGVAAAAAALEQLGWLGAGEPAAAAGPDLGSGVAGEESSGAAAPIPVEHLPSPRQDADNEAYESMEDSPGASPAGSGAAATANGTSSRGSHRQQQPSQQGGAPADALRQLARRHLSFSCLSDPSVWEQRRLMPRLAACLAAARRHLGFGSDAGIRELTGALLALACDRLAAQPTELEQALPALLEALVPAPDAAAAAAGGAPAELASSLALGAGASLAGRLPSLPARRRLWQEAHDALLPLAASLLEARQVALARRACQAAAAAATASSSSAAAAASTGAAAPPASVAVTQEELEGIAAACCLLYFYVLEAPAVTVGPAGARLQEVLLRGGLFRSLVLLFLQLGALPAGEALRCATLLSCAAAPGLLQWASAVPGFGAALSAPALAPEGPAALHGALWGVVRGMGTEALEALLEEGAATPAGVPRLHQALRLMADLHTAARGRRLWTPGVDAALRQLAGTLRERYAKPTHGAAEGGEASVGGGGAAAAAGMGGVEGMTLSAAVAREATPAEAWEQESTGAEAELEAEEARKLGRPAEEQAALLALRRAQQLQPACLRLLKELLQKQGGGKSD